MPELPEVHTTATDLNKLLKGQSISDVWTSYNSPYYKGKPQIKNPKYFKLFKKEVVGEKVVSVNRVAKNVLINLTGDKTILVHMKMTGHLLYGDYEKKGKEWIATKEGPLTDKWNGWIRLVFTLSGTKTGSGSATSRSASSSSSKKHLVLSDLRKFAKVTLLQTSTLLESNDLGKIGPDPLDKIFDFKTFCRQINKKPNGKIKTVLMNQELIAGIGNIYSDESLWMSKIDPETIVSKISDAKRKELLKNIKIILKKGIDFKGDSMSDYRRPSGEPGDFQNHHSVYQRRGEDCKRRNCKGKIARKVIGGRSSHYCASCQK